MGASSPKSLAVAGLLFNALVWGLCWWPFKQLESQGLHPLWATALVYGFVFVSMGLWLGLRGGLVSWRQHPALWLLLLASGLTNVGFNWAVTVGDVVRVVLLFYLMPAWSVLVAWWLLGEKPSPIALLRLVLALTGLFIVLKTPETPWPVPESLADVLALTEVLARFARAHANVHVEVRVERSATLLDQLAGGRLDGRDDDAQHVQRPAIGRGAAGSTAPRRATAGHSGQPACPCPHRARCYVLCRSVKSNA